MRSIYRIAMILVLFATGAHHAQAGSSTGQIGAFELNASVVRIYLAPAESPAVSCNTHHIFSANLSTPSGQSMLALISAAQKAGLEVAAIGSGACTVMAGDEDLVGVQIFGNPFQY